MQAPSIRILDMSFILKGEIDDYESLQFTRRFFRAGEFELHIALGKQNVNELQKERVIMIANQPHKAGIIMHREIVTDDNGIETLVVKGPTLGSTLDRRVTVTDSYDRVSGPAETVMKHYVNNHMVDGACATGIYADRKIPQMAIASDLGRGLVTPWQSRFEPLDVLMEKIAKWCDIGWLVRLNIPAGKWEFDVIEGRDLTVIQNVRPPVIFAHEFDNIASQSFVDSDIQYKNVGYAGGPGEDEDRLIQIVGSASGFDRREVFLDCSSAADAVELAELGAKSLAELRRIQTYDGRILDTNSFKYELDWDLGDRVTVQNRQWGLTLNSRIIEVKEIYEPASKIEVKFGDEIPTITRFTKKLLNDVKRSG